MYMPIFGIAGCFSGAGEFIGAGTQIVTANDVTESPTTGVVLGDGYLKLRTGFFLLTFARDIAEGVDREIFVEMRF